MNECRIVFQKLHISALYDVFSILSCTKKKNLAAANVFETVPTSASLKNFVPHLITNLQPSANFFFLNRTVKFMEYSRIDYACHQKSLHQYVLTNGQSDQESACLRQVEYAFCSFLPNFWHTQLVIFQKFLSTFGMLHFEKSSNMPKNWQKMKKSFVQLTF